MIFILLLKLDISAIIKEDLGKEKIDGSNHKYLSLAVYTILSSSHSFVAKISRTGIEPVTV